MRALAVLCLTLPLSALALPLHSSSDITQSKKSSTLSEASLATATLVTTHTVNAEPSEKAKDNLPLAKSTGIDSTLDIATSTNLASAKIRGTSPSATFQEPQQTGLVKGTFDVLGEAVNEDFARGSGGLIAECKTGKCA